MTERRFLIFVSLLYFLALTLIYLPFITGESEFAFGDQVYIYEPVCRYVGDAFRHGRFPLWNDSIYTGMPQTAVISPGIFYLPNLLLFLLPFSTGVCFYMLFHQLVCAVSSYFCLRRLGLSEFSSCISSLCLSGCGFIFAMLLRPDFLGIVWLPLLLLMIDSFLRVSGGLNAGALISVAVLVFMIISCGRPEVFMPGLFLAALLACVETFFLHEKKTSAAKIIMDLMSLSVGIIAGLLMAAPVIIPELEWVSLSHRAGGLRMHELLQWSANWFDWLAIVFLNPLGDLFEAANANFLPLLHKDAPHAIPWAASYFIGSAYVLFVSFGLSDLRWRPIHWLLAAIIFFALISAGDQTFLLPALLKIFPSLAIVRYPIKFLGLPLFLSTPIAARGLQMALDKSLHSKASVLALLIFALLLILLNLPGLDICREALGLVVSFAEMNADDMVLHEASYRLRESISVGLLPAIGSALAILLYQRSLLKERAVQLLIILFLLLPLIINGYGSRSISSSSGFYERVPALLRSFEKYRKSSPQKERLAIFESGHSVFIPEVYLDPTAVNTHDSVSLLFRDRLACNCNMNYGIKCSTGYELAETGFYTRLLQKAQYLSRPAYDLYSRGKSEYSDSKASDLPYARFCSLSSTDYVLTAAHTDSSSPEPALDSRFFQLAFEDSQTDSRIYRSKSQAQRFYFADKLVLINSPDEFVGRILNMDDPNSFESSAAYADSQSLTELSEALRSMQKPSSPAFKNSEIAVLSESPERLQLSFQKSFPGVLVIRDQFYPGWIARIDGREIPLVRANQVNRAVPVPAGKHELLIEYSPWSFYFSLGCAFFGFIIVLLIGRILCPAMHCSEGEPNS